MNKDKRTEDAKKKTVADNEVKEKAEYAYDNFLDDIDDDDDGFFNDIDLDDDDDLFEFHGRIVDLDKAQRYEELCEAARWLEANSNAVNKVRFFEASPSEANGHVTFSFQRLFALHGDERKVFAGMSVLADSIYTTCMDDNVIRITFSIDDIWME